MSKMEIPDVVEDLKALYRDIQPKIAKYGQLSEAEIEVLLRSKGIAKGVSTHRGVVPNGAKRR
jgi:hypothetical protein